MANSDQNKKKQNEDEKERQCPCLNIPFALNVVERLVNGSNRPNTPPYMVDMHRQIILMDITSPKPFLKTKCTSYMHIRYRHRVFVYFEAML